MTALQRILENIADNYDGDKNAAEAIASVVDYNVMMGNLEDPEQEENDAQPKV